jgi:hypothetical protein
MKNRHFLLLVPLVLPAFNSSLRAQSQISYTGVGAVDGLNGAETLNIGREFSVTGTGITIYDLGAYNLLGNGLVAPHTVALFSIASGAGTTNASASAITGGSVVVPAGSAAIREDNFAFAPLATPIYLAPGNYSVITYGMNSSDPYGDGGGLPSGPNVSPISLDPFEFTLAGSPAYPNNGDPNDHSSASFLYDPGNTVTPEPTTFAFLGAGLVALFALDRRRCNASR